MSYLPVIASYLTRYFCTYIDDIIDFDIFVSYPLSVGTFSNVDGTPFDLRKPTLLRERLQKVLVSCYCFGDHGKMKHVARYAQALEYKVYTPFCFAVKIRQKCYSSPMNNTSLNQLLCFPFQYESPHPCNNCRNVYLVGEIDCFSIVYVTQLPVGRLSVTQRSRGWRCTSHAP